VLDLLFDAAAERWGRLDTLVNVVGGTFRGAFSEQSPRAWDALMRKPCQRPAPGCCSQTSM